VVVVVGVVWVVPDGVGPRVAVLEAAVELDNSFSPAFLLTKSCSTLEDDWKDFKDRFGKFRGKLGGHQGGREARLGTSFLFG
jgi:hypothetical protein